MRVHALEAKPQDDCLSRKSNVSQWEALGATRPYPTADRFIARRNHAD